MVAKLDYRDGSKFMHNNRISHLKSIGLETWSNIHPSQHFPRANNLMIAYRNETQVVTFVPGICPEVEKYTQTICCIGLVVFNSFVLPRAYFFPGVFLFWRYVLGEHSKHSMKTFERN